MERALYILPIFDLTAPMQRASAGMPFVRCCRQRTFRSACSQLPEPRRRGITPLSLSSASEVGETF